MRIEDLFRQADEDDNGDLSLVEFRSDEAVIAAITGRQQSPGTTSRPARQTQTAASAGATARQPWIGNWRFLVLVTLNIILVGGVTWFVVRSHGTPQQRKYPTTRK
jgi:hypothetical protein